MSIGGIWFRSAMRHYPGHQGDDFRTSLAASSRRAMECEGWTDMFKGALVSDATYRLGAELPKSNCGGINDPVPQRQTTYAIGGRKLDHGPEGGGRLLNWRQRVLSTGEHPTGSGLSGKVGHGGADRGIELLEPQGRRPPFSTKQQRRKEITCANCRTNQTHRRARRRLASSGAFVGNCYPSAEPGRCRAMDIPGDAAEDVSEVDSEEAAIEWYAEPLEPRPKRHARPPNRYGFED